MTEIEKTLTTEPFKQERESRALLKQVQADLGKDFQDRMYWRVLLVRIVLHNARRIG
jgi:hypothetical protein